MHKLPGPVRCSNGHRVTCLPCLTCLIRDYGKVRSARPDKHGPEGDDPSPREIRSRAHAVRQNAKEMKDGWS
jgi:hypothetical protein